MNDDRFDLKQRENALLNEEKAKNPHLFEVEPFIDDNEFLGKLGIHIPSKDTLPSGFVKYRPEDFVVEEIDASGKVQTVSPISSSPSDSPGSTIFATLVKCGISTIEAQEDIAKSLGIPRERVRYAGIKDKDALTSQLISISGVSKNAVEQVRSPYFFLKDVFQGKGVIEKGGLKGNRFSILVRTTDTNSDKTKTDAFLTALGNIQKKGFYNFYYLQRFGNPRLNNFYWAIHLLKGDHESAVIGYLTDEGLRENAYFSQKRMAIKQAIPDWNKVLEILQDFPGILGNEIKIVRHLINNPNDYTGALRTISEQVTLWVYALSSYLFNRKISSYILADMEPPENLPLLLSPDRGDWLVYEDDLKSVGLFPPPLHNLRAFPDIKVRKNSVKTLDHVEIHGAEVVEDGIAIQFSLGKGEYATTFLSHLVNIISGKVPDDLSDKSIDTQALLGQSDLTEVFKYFENVSRTKREN